MFSAVQVWEARQLAHGCDRSDLEKREVAWNWQIGSNCAANGARGNFCFCYFPACGMHIVAIATKCIRAEERSGYVKGKEAMEAQLCSSGGV